MTLKNRLAQLEKQTPATDAARIALMKPSEILILAGEMIAAGVQPTTDERARIESLRQVIHES